MRYAVIELRFVGVCFCIRLRDTFGDNLRVTFLVACILAIRALHTSRVLEEVTAQSTPHNVVKLLLHKFVPVLLVDFFFALSNGTFSIESDVERSAVFGLLD